MKHLTLEQRLRSAHVKRWHMVRVFREQTLAEHSMLVQIVALEAADRFLAVDLKSVGDPVAFRLRVMEWAMWHDMPEVVTGDVSTPMKRFMGDNGAPGLLDTIEKQIDGTYCRLGLEAGDIVESIVKFADLFEAIRFLHLEGHGYRALEIERELISRMNAHITATATPRLGGIFLTIFDGMTYDSAD